MVWYSTIWYSMVWDGMVWNGYIMVGAVDGYGAGGDPRCLPLNHVRSMGSPVQRCSVFGDQAFFRFCVLCFLGWESVESFCALCAFDFGN